MNQDPIQPPNPEPTLQQDFNPVISPAPQPKISKKKLVIAGVVILLLGAAGFGLALYQDNQSKKPKSQNNTTTTNTQTPAQLVTDSPAVTATKDYKADFPRVEFSYPENWVVTPNKDEEGIRVESPEFSYTGINGGQTKGYFRVYIRQGARQQDSKYIGRGIASQDSEKLTYVNPPTGQRPETNLSFFGLDTPDNFGYYLIAGNFLLKKGDSLGPEYGKEAETYIISGGYSSSELTEDMATNQVPLEYFKTTNAYNQSLKILKSLKLL